MSRKLNGGRYLVGPPLASGGMGTVYLGVQRGSSGFRRRVAIKRPHPEFLRDSAFVSSFLREGHLGVLIRHPNVVDVLDVVDEDGPWLIMDYVHGCPLSALLRHARESELLALPLLSRIVLDALLGLAAAHEARDEQGRLLGLVHRDISPQNLLLASSGRTLVVDFGIARVASATTITEPGMLKGKFGYMAPEYLAGGEVDHRADLYAIGVILWEAVCGRRLHKESSQAAQIALLMLAGPPPRASTLRPSIPSPLDEFLARALDPSPEKRFGSASEMAAELQQVLPPATHAEVAAELRRRALVVEAPPPLVSETSDDSLSQPLPLVTSHDAITAPPVRFESVTATHPPPHAPSRLRRPLLAGGAAFAALVVTLMAVSWRGETRSLTAPQPSAVTSPDELPPGRSSASLDPSASAPPSAAATSPPVPSSSSPRSTATAPRVDPRPSATPRTKRNCSPPWRLDDSGRKVFLPECF